MLDFHIVGFWQFKLPLQMHKWKGVESDVLPIPYHHHSGKGNYIGTVLCYSAVCLARLRLRLLNNTNLTP